MEKFEFAHWLKVEAHVRYWEDATVNGIKDTNGTLIPFKKGEMWKPLIELSTGSIVDWPIGTTAKIHYKVCDSGSYYLLDSDGNAIASIEENYVPPILDPKGNGYGDNIILDIDENGKINNWKRDFSNFE